MVNRIDMTRQGIWNNRGVALLITLLVTALLIALIFEFAYGTRVSLRAAVNFRDSQRAYFLARSGMYAFAKSDDLKDSIPQGEWGVVPIVSGGDTELRIKWEDEKGKIKISKIRKNDTSNPSYDWMAQLFFSKVIDLNILEKVINDQMIFQLPTQLHQVMSDEDFPKIEKFVTTMTPDYQINIYTASREVLESLGITQAESLMTDRGQVQFTKPSDLQSYFSSQQAYNKVSGFLGFSSNIYKVYSYATVGDYTKQVEAIIQKKPFTVLYWRAL
jgi:type II secretory pathway component PulK